MDNTQLIETASDLPKAQQGQIGEGLAFLAAFLKLSGISNLVIDNVNRDIAWEMIPSDRGPDMTELDSFFGDVENRFYSLRAVKASREDV